MIDEVERDKRAKLNWWAPGFYRCFCFQCNKYYVGAKRSGCCAPCAYEDKKPEGDET